MKRELLRRELDILFYLPLVGSNVWSERCTSVVSKWFESGVRTFLNFGPVIKTVKI